MNLGNVRVLKKPLVLAKPAQVDALEAKLWVAFPAGYREYVTTLGEGTLGGAFVRVYPPWRIEAELAEWRQRVAKYWFWDKGKKLLPKERGVECVVVADTANGDELVFHPARPGLFLLPRDEEKVYALGPDLLAAVEWMCSSGKLTPPFPERDFEPFDSRKQPKAADTRPADPPGESLDEVVATAGSWAKRRAAKKRALADAKKVAGADETVKLRYEALVLDGEYPTRAGYLAVYRATDAASGLEVGTILWTMDDDSWGSTYEPHEANRAKLKRKK
jgi:hypothetical protein